MLRATHRSDESRFPFDKRRSALPTARRIVRGSPINPKSVDWWPGLKASNFPAVPTPSDEPLGEPSDVSTDRVVLRKSLSIRANPFNVSGEFHSPPPCVRDYFRGEPAAAPQFPLCDLGLTRDEVQKLHGPADADTWWDSPLHLGRVPFDSKYCAIWHAFFESFAPVERVLVPVSSAPPCSKRPNRR